MARNSTKTIDTGAAFAAIGNAVANGVAAPAHKYAKAPGISDKVVSQRYAMHAKAPADANATGMAKTVMHAVAMAAYRATAQGTQTATGQAIADEFVAMWLAGNVPVGNVQKYAPGGILPCGAWLSGYIRGAACAKDSITRKA